MPSWRNSMLCAMDRQMAAPIRGTSRQSRRAILIKMFHVDGDRSPYQYLSYQPGSTRNGDQRDKFVSKAQRIPSSPRSANGRMGAMVGAASPDGCACSVIGVFLQLVRHVAPIDGEDASGDEARAVR